MGYISGASGEPEYILSDLSKKRPPLKGSPGYILTVA
jgi:hypothetical protein